MALTEKLELLLTADPTQGISALKSFSSEAERTASKTTSSLQRIGTSAMKLGAGGIGVGGFLTQMASGDIEAANQMSAAIQQVGQSQADYKDRIDDTVGAMAKFGATDEEVSKAVTTLTLAYNDTGAALDNMQLVADLAARKHTTLADAATMVAKAHGGAGRLFKEFGIVVKEGSDGAKNYDAALTELSQKLSGQASASADSFGGKLRELRAHAENLVSEFGQNFGPMILGVSTGFTALGGVMSGAGALMSRFKTATVETTAATNSAASVQSLYNKQVGASKLALAGGATALAATVVGLYAYGQSLNKTAADVSEFSKLSDQSWDQQTQTALELIDTYKGPFAGSIDNLIQHYRDLGPAGVEELQRIRDALAASGGDTSKFDAAIAGAAQQTKNLGGAADTTAKSLDDMAKKYKDIQRAADDAFAATLKLAPADIRVKEGALNIADAQARVAEAERDLTDAQTGTKASSQDLAQAHLNQEEAAAKLADAQAELAKKPNDAAAQRAVRQAYLDVQKANEATSKLNVGPDPGKIEDARRAVEDAKLAYISAVQDQAVAAEELKNTQDEANGVTSTAETRTYDYLAALTYLNAGLTGPTHDALAGYIWDATVAANKTRELRVEALGGTGFTGEHVDLSRTAANRAAGGTGFPGSTYFIEPGTKGEYFTPSSSGWFTPVDKMGGKGGYTVNIGQIVTSDPADAGEAVARRLRIEAVLAGP